MFQSNKFLKYLLEADDDTADNAAPDNASDNTNDTSNVSSEDNNNQNNTGPDNNNQDDNTDAGNEPEDDDFSIDTTMDDNTGAEDNNNGQDQDTDSSDSNNSEENNEQPVKANTDIFSSLSPEEQAIKIKELKKLYAELYYASNDLLDRLNKVNLEQNNIEVVSRITKNLYTYNYYLNYYITNVFSIKSYIENDIQFNRLLAILDGIKEAINIFVKDINKDIGKK